MIFEMQLVMDAMLQTQMIRRKSIVDHRDIDPDRIGRRGAAGAGQSDQQAVLNGISLHSDFPTRMTDAPA
jgi:hypothetical protein